MYSAQFYSRVLNWFSRDANIQLSLYWYILFVHLNCIFVCIKLFSFSFVSLVVIIFIFFGVFDPEVRSLQSTPSTQHPRTPTPRFRNTPFYEQNLSKPIAEAVLGDLLFNGRCDVLSRTGFFSSTSHDVASTV